MKKLTDINKDFSGWYQDVIFQSELVDSSPTRGCMVIRPYGYAIWENFVKILDKKIKVLEVENAYFPLLIPESFLKREAEHVEGFAPEIAVVTHAGGKKLEEPFVIRPTSETMIYHMFARWIHSWRDLPLKINQWGNVMRWEMRPRAFLRTTEFLWQEGHTAHETKEQANKMALDARAMYKDFVENFLAIPVFEGIKTESEKFAGAERTYCIEAIMPDGRGLQMGTTHLLAHSFPKSFEISFQDKDGNVKTPYCSSWGVSTRMVGGLIMSHGDENGLIIPPKVAPIQIVIVPIYKNDEEKQTVLNKAEEIKNVLVKKGLRVVCDYDDTKTPGARFFHWELKGVPLRIEIGPRDIEKNQVVIVDRVETDKTKKKSFITMDSLEKSVEEFLQNIQKKLFDRAKEKVTKLLQSGDKLENFCNNLEKENGVYKSGFCGSGECEAKLKNYKGTIRCFVDPNVKSQKECFACESLSIGDVIIAKSY